METVYTVTITALDDGTYQLRACDPSGLTPEELTALVTMFTRRLEAAGRDIGDGDLRDGPLELEEFRIGGPDVGRLIQAGAPDWMVDRARELQEPAEGEGEK